MAFLGLGSTILKDDTLTVKDDCFEEHNWEAGGKCLNDEISAI